MGWFEYFRAQQSLEFPQNDVKNKNIQGAAVLQMETPCWCPENDQTGASWQKGHGDSDNYSVLLWWVEMYLGMYDTWNPEVDGLQQQKTMPGSTPVRRRQKAAASVGTGWPKLQFKTEKM